MEKYSKITKTEKKLAEIIEATFNCISEKGYDKVTMKEISKYAKMSKGAINHYFKKKEDILVAVLEELDRKLFKNVDDKIKNGDENVKGSKAVEDMLRYRLSGSFELTKADPTIMYVLVDFASLSRNDTRYHDIIKHFFSKYSYLSSIGVKKGIQSGLYKNVVPEEIGVIIVAIVIGIGIQWILNEGSFDYDSVTQIAEDMVINFLEK